MYFKHHNREARFIIYCFPAFQHGKLYYRGLEIGKINGLRVGGYRTRISLSNYAKEDLRYWLGNANMSGSPTQAGTAFVELFTDAVCLAMECCSMVESLVGNGQLQAYSLAVITSCTRSIAQGSAFHDTKEFRSLTSLSFSCRVLVLSYRDFTCCFMRL